MRWTRTTSTSTQRTKEEEEEAEAGLHPLQSELLDKDSGWRKRVNESHEERTATWKEETMQQRRETCDCSASDRPNQTKVTRRREAIIRDGGSGLWRTR